LQKKLEKEVFDSSATIGLAEFNLLVIAKKDKGVLFLRFVSKNFQTGKFISVKAFKSMLCDRKA